MKKYHLGDILSITTGLMLSPRNMSGVRDILEYMTNSDLATIGLIMVKEKCAKSILEQLPQLREINLNHYTKDNCDVWMSKQIHKYGEYLEVRPI